jgi:phospholipid/cholesterol/gamma-HCH transport system substrate-binding protein
MKLKLSECIKVMCFVAIGCGVMYIIYRSLTQLTVIDPKGYSVKSAFHDIKQLQVGDDVRLAGVRVGSVADTYLDHGLAIAILRIEEKYKISRDSVATILTSGLLGGNYVSISSGQSTDRLVDGSIVRTKESADLSTIINSFGSIGERLESLLSQWVGAEKSDGGAGVSTGPSSLFSDLSSFFSENKPKLNAIIDNLDTVVGRLARGEGTIGKLLHEEIVYDDIRGIAENVNRTVDKAGAFVDRLHEVVDQVEKGDGVLAKLISDKSMARDFETIVGNVREFSQRLNNTQSTIGKLLDNDELYVKAKDTIDKVSQAADGLNNNGPVTAVGVAASALF